MVRRSVLPLLVLACLALPLTACTTTAEEPTPDLPEQDQASGRMPLDEYSTLIDSSLPSYAENLLVASCLGEEGIDWPIPWEPTEEEQPVSASAPFLVESARNNGYRGLATELPPESGQQGFDALSTLNTIAASVPGFQPLFDSCLEEARTQVPTEQNMMDINWLLGIRNSAWEASRKDEAVIASGKDWRACLSALGYRTLPDSPDGDENESMPTAGLRTELGIPERYGTPPVDSQFAPENPLVPQEIALAVDDATCRDSSGWNVATYQAQWEAETELLTENADELVRIRDTWKTERAHLLEVIAAHAPEH